MTYLNSIRVCTLCRSLPLAFAAGVLAFSSARAHAAGADPLDPVQLDEITVSAPAAKTVGHETTGEAIQQVTVSARVQAETAALRTKYGALMLEYSVREAARKVCNEADPFMEDDGTCFKKALESAKPQMDAAIAQARTTHND